MKLCPANPHAVRANSCLRALSVVLSGLFFFAGACGGDLPAADDSPRTETRSSALVQTCTATNVQGNPYQGQLCGGAFIDNCTPGLIYTCTGGPRGTTGNCTLAQSCSVGCLTGPGDTPVTANIGTATPVANDACFTGPAPLTFSTNATTGGSYVTMTATLNNPHSPYAVVNFQGTTADVPPLCDVPLLLQPNATSVSWIEPTNVVASTKNVPLWTLISFNDSSGALRNLVSVTNPLTLNPGGTLPKPPLQSFSVTDANGSPISTIPGGSNVFTHGTLAASTPAPVGGTRGTVTSNPANAFVSDGSFTIDAGCTSNFTAGTLTASSAFTSNVSATVSATSGGGATLSQNVVVTPPPLAVQSVTLTPSTVTGGASLTGTVGLNRVVLASDANSTVSVRIAEGNISGAQLATFPGCTGTPACTGPLTVAQGSKSASFTISTKPVASQDFVTVAASAPWSNSSASANITINPGGSTGPALSSLVMTPSSGTCGFSTVGTVTLTDAAPAGGAVVALSSSSTSNAQVPASVTVAAGQTQASFNGTTGPTCNMSSVLITATYAGVSKQNALFFNASGGSGGGAATLTLTASGRSGESVFSTPAGLSVHVGTTGSASFAVGTRISLQATNGRSAVWSGACSSGGSTTKTCTFTLGANASVTANVR